MKSNIILQNNNDFINLNLSEEYDGLICNKFVGIVYQDKSYELVIEFDEVDEVDDEVVDVQVLLNNNEPQWKEKVFDSINKTFRFSTHIGFCMLFGGAKFTVIFSFKDGSEKVFFSNSLGVAIKEEDMELQTSVEEMLNVILEKEHNLMHDKGYIQGAKRSRANLNPKINLEINLIENLIHTYSINLPYFMRDLKCRMDEVAKINDFEKLKNINSKTLHYIVAHPEQLQQVNYNTGICLNGMNVQPRKTLVSMGKEEYDIYENRIILGFLKYILLYLYNRYSYIIKLLANKDSISFDNTLMEGYILSENIIKKYAKRELESFASQLNEKIHNLDMLYMQYKRVFPCGEAKISGKPSSTAIFQNVNHYRNIFVLISRWFDLGEYNLSTERQILNFVTADQIYEYFCLLNIIEGLIELGYKEDVVRRTVYQYNVKREYYKRPNDDNTFYFKKENDTVTFYIQPVLYSNFNTKSNGISLFRTDSGFWMPDFILKHVDKNGIASYAILDAKWRKRRNVEFEKMVFKYIYSVSDSVNGNGEMFMWILQGKDEKYKINMDIYQHNSGYLSKHKGGKFVNSSGIVAVTPKYGNKDLKFVLEAFLE